MIKAVILDFGGVVFKNKPKEKWVGPKGDLDVDSDLWNKGRLGLVDDEEIFAEIGKNYGEDPKTIRNWLFSRREPNKGLIELLNRLKPGIKKALINNGLKSLFYGFLQRYSLPIQFEELICSADEGVMKPDPKIYLDTCKKLGVVPEECIFVDDDQVNLNGAKELGMIPAFFSDVEFLKQEFINQGILSIT